MNLPNKISMSRIFIIPFVVFFYLADFIPNAWGKIIALILFAITGLTDFVDGHIARKYNMVTDLGKFLDSIADKLHMTTGLLLVVTDGTIMAPYGVIMAVIIISREFIVSALRQIAAARGKVLAADMIGKVKATFQPVGIALFMFLAINKARPFLGGATLAIEIISYVVMSIAVVMTIISGIYYLVKNREVLKEDKKED